jgi:hypothetical protein
MNAIDCQLLSQVMHDRAASRLLVRSSWLIAACILAQLTFVSVTGNSVLGNALLLGLVCGVAYLWCGAFLKSAVQQNLPSNAVLVPGLRHSLMRLTAWLYLGATLLTAVLGGVLLGHAGYGLLAGGLFSIYILYAQRYYGLNFAPSVIVIGSLWVSKHPLTELMRLLDAGGEPLLTAIGAVLLALLGKHALHSVFPRGGDRHWAWHQRQKRQLLRTRDGVLNNEPGHGLRWLAWLRRPYNAALRADSRNGASQGRQMMHVLGTAAHDGGAIAYAVVSAAIMAAAGRYMTGRSDPVAVMVSSTMMQGMLMLSLLIYASTVSFHIMRFSTEQGLYRLTPAAPASAHFNRVLMGMLLFRCLRLWLISALAIGCIDAVILGQLEVRGITYALAMLVLPFAALVLRDYASAPARPNGVLAVVMSSLVVAAYIALSVVDQMHPGLPLFWFGNCVGLVTAIVLRLRWQQVIALPPVLPAGRLAV